MRKFALIAVFAFLGTISANTARVSANTLDSSVLETVIETGITESSAKNFGVQALIDEELLRASDEMSEATKPAAPKPPKQVKHTVAEGDSLASIAKKYNSTWKRLFYKNKQIEDPDVITAGQKILVPKNNEKLKERDIPEDEPVAPIVRSRSVQRTSVARTEPAPQPMQTQTLNRKPSYTKRGSSSGNWYTYGYCTWYVKNLRPDLPNNLGNAETWTYRAAAQGISTGSTPRVGAVGQRGNHVVYVESVNKGGTVTISEMNRVGWNVKSTRTVPANMFRYIY